MVRNSPDNSEIKHLMELIDSIDWITKRFTKEKKNTEMKYYWLKNELRSCKSIEEIVSIDTPYLYKPDYFYLNTPQVIFEETDEFKDNYEKFLRKVIESNNLLCEIAMYISMYNQCIDFIKILNNVYIREEN